MQTPEPETPETGKRKKRHGCLTAWLILIIVVAIISTVRYLAGAIFWGSFGNLPGWVIPVSVIGVVFTVVCAGALFKWKKWGFWGYCAISVVAFIINISFGLGVTSFAGLVGVAILYGVLNIGGENKGWSQLE
jgi:hypothetical protein